MFFFLASALVVLSRKHHFPAFSWLLGCHGDIMFTVLLQLSLSKVDGWLAMLASLLISLNGEQFSEIRLLGQVFLACDQAYLGKIQV